MARPDTFPEDAAWEQQIRAHVLSCIGGQELDSTDMAKMGNQLVEWIKTGTVPERVRAGKPKIGEVRP